MNRDEPAFPTALESGHCGLTKGELELILYRAAMLWSPTLAWPRGLENEIVNRAILLQRAASEAEAKIDREFQ